MAELWSGKAFDILERELSVRGVKLDPNPNRPSIESKVIKNERLIRLFRTFLAHVKSNRLSMVGLRKRLAINEIGTFKFRHNIFLSLFETIWMAWDQWLQNEKAIDFDDMLNLASDCIDSGKWQNSFQLIMVDEFQDASQSRAGLIQALLKGEGQYLFAVGDDWQSINRFAGSYVGCMSGFEELFGPSTILKLENTFRCPQTLCDISSSFVQKNPAQIKKTVRSATNNVDKPIKIIRVKDVDHIPSAVEYCLNESAAQISPAKCSVLVLGRHRYEQTYMPKGTSYKHLTVSFKTIHASKGLEADHIIIPFMINGTLGFPNQIEDDPLLSLAMPDPDNYLYSEERRLFYVALTRAKQTVTLITVEKRVTFYYGTG